MNAKDARRLSDECIEKNLGIEDILEDIYKQIKVCVSRGEYKLKNPFSCRSAITYDQEDRLKKALIKQGYKYNLGGGNQFDREDPYLSW